MNFSVLAEAFEKMENTTKRLELTDYLVGLFHATPPEVISKIVYLIQGKIRPDYEGVELGIAEKLAIRAVSKSSGIEIGKIEDALKKDGDLGRAASGILSQRKQTASAITYVLSAKTPYIRMACNSVYGFNSSFYT